MVSEEVTADDIAEVISSWTGIPAGRMLQGESEKLLEMEKRIGERLIGQEADRGCCGGCGSPRPRRNFRPEPPDWFLPVPGTDRCG